MRDFIKVRLFWLLMAPLEALVAVPAVHAAADATGTAVSETSVETVVETETAETAETAESLLAVADTVAAASAAAVAVSSAVADPQGVAPVTAASSVATSSVVSSAEATASSQTLPETEEATTASSSSLASDSASSPDSSQQAIPDSSTMADEVAASSASQAPVPRAESIDLKEVIRELESPGVPLPLPGAPVPVEAPPLSSVAADPGVTASSASSEVGESRIILGMEVPPATATRLVWTPDTVVAGLAEQTPVLVVNGRHPGQTLCLTAAVHGDELNGIEMIRRVMYQLDPEKLTGTVIGVPVVNLMGFRRNSRYLPDRRDLNRYFPGNTHGSSASRIAHSFFTNIITHCNALVDIHTGSFHRTNLTQLRADLSNEQVAALAQGFGNIAVLNSRGNTGSLRSAAVRAGIPSVTVEAGEPMRLQNDIVEEGTRAIGTLMAKTGMYGRHSKWQRNAPVYYKSVWVRANQSGILFSRAPLGKRVNKGEVLGTVTDPITNARSDIVSPLQGRILGMALDQVVLPGFAAYHIGIQTPEAILIEEGLLDDEDGDDVPRAQSQDTVNDLDALTRPQDSPDDEE